MANIGYRTFNGSSDVFLADLGNLTSAASLPETWMWAGRLLFTAADSVIVASPGFAPVDFYAIGATTRYAFYDGSGNATDGPLTTGGLDLILVMRRASSTAVRWSIATHNGSVWSSFTHTNSATTFASGSYAGSGTLNFFGTSGAFMNARAALVGRCSTSLSDGDVDTLTTDMAAWQAIASMTNLWRFDQTPIVDLEGTATSNSLTGTSVTANGFPLDEGSAPAAGIDVPALVLPRPAVVRSNYW